MSFCSNYEKFHGGDKEKKCFTEEDLIQEEFLNDLKLSYIQKKIVEFLINLRGYCPEDIEINKEFIVSLENKDFKAMADLIIKSEDKRFIFVKCAPNSPDSWERYSLAFCRAIDSYQIPYAFITDGDAATLLNTIDGTAIQGDINIMPSKNEAESLCRSTALESYPEAKKEREKRIVYAFESIKNPLKKTDS